MPNSANTPAPVSAPATRAESEVVREMPMAAVSRSAGMVSATSATRTPRSEGRTMPIRPVMMSTTMRAQMAGKRDRQQGRRQRRRRGAHGAQHVAMADAVAGHAEDRRHQRAGKQQRAEHGEHQHRTRLDQHVPAEDQRFHLEGAGREQVGRPLEAEAANPERRHRRRPQQRTRPRTAERRRPHCSPRARAAPHSPSYFLFCAPQARANAACSQHARAPYLCIAAARCGPLPCLCDRYLVVSLSNHERAEDARRSALRQAQGEGWVVSGQGRWYLPWRQGGNRCRSSCAS